MEKVYKCPVCKAEMDKVEEADELKLALYKFASGFFKCKQCNKTMPVFEKQGDLNNSLENFDNIAYKIADKKLSRE